MKLEAAIQATGERYWWCCKYGKWNALPVVEREVPNVVGGTTLRLLGFPKKVLEIEGRTHCTSMFYISPGLTHHLIVYRSAVT